MTKENKKENKKEQKKKGNNSNKSNKNDNKKKKNPYSIYWIYAAIGIAIIGIQLFMSSSSTQELDSKESFYALMEK